MALPVATGKPAHRCTDVPEEFLFALDTLLYQFYREQGRRPTAVLLVGYEPKIVGKLCAANIEQVVVCDVNAPPVIDSVQVHVIRQHSVRIPNTVRVDVVILNVFNTATVNRWAPVYLVRDLLWRGIVRTFPKRLPYVFPSKSTMSIRLYHHPTMENVGPSGGVTRVRWRTAAALTNTDLLVPAGPRVDVLYENYDSPAQCWPSTVALECLPADHSGTIAVLEWTLQLLPGILLSYLAPRATNNVLHARRLVDVGMDYFPWSDIGVAGAPVSFSVTPKATGGVNLTVTDAAGVVSEMDLTLQKMKTAIERWYGDVVSKEL